MLSVRSLHVLLGEPELRWVGHRAGTWLLCIRTQCGTLRATEPAASAEWSVCAVSARAHRYNHRCSRSRERRRRQRARLVAGRRTRSQRAGSHMSWLAQAARAPEPK
eukprot:5877839-Prymnesium_polylepis.3